MKGIVSLCGLIVTGFFLLILSFKALSMPLGDRKEAEKLQAIIEQQDATRREIVEKYLDGDPLLNGNSYRSYDQARRARLNQMSYRELVAKLKELEAEHVKQAARLAGIAIPAEKSDGKLRETSGFGGTVRRGASRTNSQQSSGKPWSSYSSYMASHYEDLLRHQSGDSFDDIPHFVPNHFDPSHEEYTVEMPSAVTGSAPRKMKVRVSPGKMEMLKQKQQLDQMLINDVLKMTGKLP
ncbi:hypothetical protein [Endozoicomonas arenosclerae]|uniref:hypothetical protein n=1 Tax=Endozoicomonas arenosclerae TaxID=1633495 RepID=UPI000781DFB5|nr:hypothetical protein [Endozoicomonas arenosclerae]